MGVTVQGNWQNEFGSIMGLAQERTGELFGVYQSSTGSTGVYFVLGWANPNPPTEGLGPTLAISISWRTFEGLLTDSSYHYVSAMSGQMLVLNPPSSLNMIHALVATVPDGNAVPNPGTFMDKLIFNPYTGTPDYSPQRPPSSNPSPGEIDGLWQCTQDPTIELTLTSMDQTFGYVTGTLTTSAGSTSVVGFRDASASAQGLELESLSVSGLLPDGSTVVGLAGSLNLITDILTLAWLDSVATTPGSTWIQTDLKGLNFTRVSAE